MDKTAPEAGEEGHMAEGREATVRKTMSPPLIPHTDNTNGHLTIRPRNSPRTHPHFVIHHAHGNLVLDTLHITMNYLR